MKIAVQLEPETGPPPDVAYRWDPDTEILIATMGGRDGGDGLSGTVEIQGEDGSWLNLDVARGCIHAIEVAVWPDVRNVGALEPPPNVETVRVTVPSRRQDHGLASVEVDTPLSADADQSERTIHFRLGRGGATRTVRIARDLLLDVDRTGRLAGFWLLNVPPLPEGS